MEYCVILCAAGGGGDVVAAGEVHVNDAARSDLLDRDDAWTAVVRGGDLGVPGGKADLQREDEDRIRRSREPETRSEGMADHTVEAITAAVALAKTGMGN